MIHKGMRALGLFVVAILIPAVAHAVPIHINTANAALLDTLPGIGPAKAAAIIDYRTKHGPFATIEDIQKVSGIGPTTFANMKTQITVGPPSPEASKGAVQPPAETVSYEKIQTVDQISSTKNESINDEVRAPAAATELAAAGAALPPPKTPAAAGLLHSPWLFGLLAVIVVAGGIFIFL